jgi:hypothetical protein
MRTLASVPLSRDQARHKFAFTRSYAVFRFILLERMIMETTKESGAASKKKSVRTPSKKTLNVADMKVVNCKRKKFRCHASL